MELKISEMQENDLNFFNGVRNLSIDFLHDKTKYNIIEVRKWFKKTNNVYYIVKNNKNKRIGYFRTSNFIENSCYIGMDIHPTYRGFGYSQRLYPIFMQKLFQEKQIQTFYLEVLKMNKRAIHIYNKLGFNVIFENEHNIKMVKSYEK